MRSKVILLICLRTALCEFSCSITPDGVYCEESELNFKALKNADMRVDGAIVATERLHVAHCRIYAIEGDAFAGFGTVKQLNLSNNLIGSVVDDQFGALPEVENIDLSKNAISQVFPRAFASNAKLLHLNLSDNILFVGDFTENSFPQTTLFRLYIDNNSPEIYETTIRSRDGHIDGSDTIFHRLVASFVFGNNRPLKPLSEQLKHLIGRNTYKLSFSRNNVKVLPSNVFDTCKRLIYLKLSYNKLELLQSDVFSKNALLRIVHLQSNRLSVLPEDLFKVPKSLAVIDLRDNLIDYLPPNLIRHLSNLEAFRIGDNRIQSIPNGFFGSNTNLLTLDLGGNRIKHLDPGALANQRLLRGLDLSANGLSSISYSTIKDMNALKKLRLSNNRLADISPNFYSHRLEELSIFCNNLTYFPTTIASVNSESFYFHGNPWKCGCLSHILSLKTSFRHPGWDPRIPFVCLIGRDESICNDVPLDGQFLKEWEGSRGLHPDNCHPALKPVLEL